MIPPYSLGCRLPLMSAMTPPGRSGAELVIDIWNSASPFHRRSGELRKCVAQTHLNVHLVRTSPRSSIERSRHPAQHRCSRRGWMRCSRRWARTQDALRDWQFGGLLPRDFLGCLRISVPADIIERIPAFPAAALQPESRASSCPCADIFLVGLGLPDHRSAPPWRSNAPGKAVSSTSQTLVHCGQARRARIGGGWATAAGWAFWSLPQGCWFRGVSGHQAVYRPAPGKMPRSKPTPMVPTAPCGRWSGPNRGTFWPPSPARSGYSTGRSGGPRSTATACSMSITCDRYALLP